jgi:hypothetical protein
LLPGDCVFTKQRAESPLPQCDIHPLPFFMSETATQSRVVTPDSAIAAFLVSTLGGGADSVMRMIQIYQSQKIEKTWVHL